MRPLIPLSRFSVRGYNTESMHYPDSSFGMWNEKLVPGASRQCVPSFRIPHFYFPSSTLFTIDMRSFFVNGFTT